VNARGAGPTIDVSWRSDAIVIARLAAVIALGWVSPAPAARKPTRPSKAAKPATSAGVWDGTYVTEEPADAPDGLLCPGQGSNKSKYVVTEGTSASTSAGSTKPTAQEWPPHVPRERAAGPARRQDGQAPVRRGDEHGARPPTAPRPSMAGAGSTARASSRTTFPSATGASRSPSRARRTSSVARSSARPSVTTWAAASEIPRSPASFGQPTEKICGPDVDWENAGSSYGHR
jgi:hypothetical protein